MRHYSSRYAVATRTHFFERCPVWRQILNSSSICKAMHTSIPAACVHHHHACTFISETVGWRCGILLGSSSSSSSSSTLIAVGCHPTHSQPVQWCNPHVHFNTHATVSKWRAPWAPASGGATCPSHASIPYREWKSMMPMGDIDSRCVTVHDHTDTAANAEKTQSTTGTPARMMGCVGHASRLHYGVVGEQVHNLLRDVLRPQQPVEQHKCERTFNVGGTAWKYVICIDRAPLDTRQSMDTRQRTMQDRASMQDRACVPVDADRMECTCGHESACRRGVHRRRRRSS